MAVDVVVVIYDNRITAMNYPGGMIWRWAFQKSRRIERLAKLYAPKRTGRLAESVSSHYTGSSRDNTIMTVSAGGPRAPHAIYVIKGTKDFQGRTRLGRFAPRGYIYPTHSRALNLPWGPRARVRGQAANDFLSRAMGDVIRTL